MNYHWINCWSEDYQIIEVIKIYEEVLWSEANTYYCAEIKQGYIYQLINTFHTKGNDYGQTETDKQG